MSIEYSESYNVSCSNPFFGGPQLPEVCAGGQVLFLTLLNTLVATNPKIGDPCGRVNPVRRTAASYDFIVVGGGAAGPIVAARLSEVPDWKVLLLEAGPDEPAGAEIPSNLQLYLNTELDWKYETVNESYACLNRGGSCVWPRGKNLGGCTAHHGMAYHRGHAKDYQRWVEMGCKGWSWQEVLPFFKLSEDNKELNRVSYKYHGVGGPMTVERFPWQPQFAWDVLQAANETGYGTTEDMVGDKITGFTVAQTISRDGVRLSSAAAYLRPNRDRKNLDVALNATVTQILTTKVSGKIKATGVKYVMNGRTYTARAKREVIISAGAINSPQLLLLSGIGPQEHLKSVGIRPVVDLPGVGENLHNHASYGLDFVLQHDDSPQSDISSAEQYLYNQTGPMSSTGLAQLTGIIVSNYTTADDPDLQIFFAGYQDVCDTNGRISDLASFDGLRTVRFSSVNLQTLSRGRISLKSKDPLTYPVIWSNELSHPRDASIIVQGIRAIQRLANSTVLQEKYGLKLATTKISACSSYQDDSDDYWTCAVQWDTRPENHQAGTCKMGSVYDPMAVVDPRLNVYGVTGLRVADASVIPKMVSGNPVAVVNMVGERAAVFIKSDWNVVA